MAKYRLTSPDGKKYEVTAPDDATQEQVLDYFTKQVGQAKQDQPVEIDAADRALRRTRNQASFGLLDAPFDAAAAAGNVALGRDEGRGLSGEYTRQRAKTKAALANDSLNAPDVAADTAGQVIGAAATIPLTASRTVGEMGLTAWEAGKNALMRNLAPRSEETLAANVAAKDMTRRQMIGEGARVGGGIGVAGGYTSSPDDATTGDVLAHMAEHGVGGAAFGAALPPVFEAAASTINWGKNKLLRPSTAARERALAAAADAEATGGSEFAPELGGDLVQGTSSGLAGTVFGGPIRAGAKQSLDTLHASVQREIEAAGGAGTPAEIGDQAQKFLRKNVEGRTRTPDEIRAMDPLELHDISGVPPAPGVKVTPPRVEPVQPREIAPITRDQVLSEAEAGVTPVAPKPVTDLEKRYKPPTPEEVELAPEMVKRVQKAGADVGDLERRLQAETENHEAIQKALVEEITSRGYVRAVPQSHALWFMKPAVRPGAAERVGIILGSDGKFHNSGPVSPEDRDMAMKVMTWMRDHRKQAAESIQEVQAKLEAARREHDIVQREMDAFRVQELPKLAAKRRAEALADAEKANAAEASIATQKARQGARAKADADAVQTAMNRTNAARDEEAARAQRATAERQLASDTAHQADLQAAQERVGEPLRIGERRPDRRPAPEGQEEVIHSYPTEFDAAYAQYRNNAPQVRMNPLGARPPVYRAPPQPQRGARYSPAEIEDAVAALEASRSAPNMPETLSQFIRKMGGINDKNNEVRHILGGITGAGRMINKKTGRTLDDIGQAAHEAGFFTERPTIPQLLDALDNDIRGLTPHVRAHEQDGLLALREHAQTMQELERVGIAGAKTAEEARQIMASQLGPRPPRQRENLAPIRPADEIHATADLLDRFATEAPMGALKYKRGELFDEKGAIHPEVMDYLRQRLGKKIADQIEHLSNLRAAPGQAFAPGLDKLHRLHTDIGQEIRDISASGRSGHPGQPRTESDAMLSRLYDALDRDIQNITRAGGRQGEVALRQRDQIDQLYDAFVNKIRAPLKKIFPETVDKVAAFQELVAATQTGSKKHGTLEAFYKVLKDKGDRAQGTAWLLNDMTRGGVRGFLERYRNISPDARQLMEEAAPDLMRFLDAAARRGGRLEGFIKTASDDYSAVAPWVRPGNIGLGSLGWLFGVPGAVAEAVGAVGLSKVLASKWYAGWLKSYPIQREPMSPQLQRHMNRLYSLATEDLGLNKSAAKTLKSALEPGKAKAGPAGAAISNSRPPEDTSTSGSGWADNLPRIGEAKNEEDLKDSPWMPVKPDLKSRDNNSFKPEVQFGPGYPHPTIDGRSPQFRQGVLFAGERSKTADKDELIRAKAMIASDEDPGKVWAETGWYQGKDGQWRTEIDDKKAKLTIPKLSGAKQEVRLGKILQHPDLFAAYPQLANIKVILHKGDGVPDGRAAITVDMEDGTPPHIEIGAEEPDKYELLKTVLHEVNHLLEGEEGFDYGEGRYDERQGEVDARNVEGRLRFNKDERRAHYPPSTQDIPWDKVRLSRERQAAGAK